MYIDFRCPRTATNPYCNNKLYNLRQDITQISKYQYSIHCAENEVPYIKKILHRHHYIVLHVYPDQMARSTNYRQIFFRTYKGSEYRCLYCNRKLTKEGLQVDHIYPVRKAKTKAGQRYLKRHGMDTVNDPKNLAAACPRCNKRKGAKGGIWLIKAKLGQYKWYWKARVIGFCILCVGAGIGLWYLHSTTYVAPL